MIQQPRFRADCDRFGCKQSLYLDGLATPDVAVNVATTKRGWVRLSTGPLICRQHAAPGRGYAPVAEDRAEWRPDRYGYSRCRARYCGAKAVLQLRRSHGDGFRWWGYCAEHAYGRWVEGDVVHRWELAR